MSMSDQLRTPYVGAGADGARRSAQIDRDELATLPADHPRRDSLEASAAYWDTLAAVLEERER